MSDNTLFITFVVAPCLIHVPVSTITHDEMTSNQEISFSTMMHYLSFSGAGDQERGQGFETVQGTFQAEIWAPGTIKENCVEVTGRLRWEVWISSVCLRDLA